MSCDLFERDGLLQLERGVPLDPHFETCADCLEARRVYEQLGERVAELDIEAEPSPAWKAHVWARIDQHRQSDPAAAFVPSVSTMHGRRQWVRWFAPIAAVATLAIVAWVAWTGLASHRRVNPPVALPAVSLTAEIYSGQTTVRRGTDAHPGDRLHVAGALAGYEHAELRVYFNDKEVAAKCSAESPCTREGNTISITAPLRSVGTYRPVLVVSHRPIPGAVAELDRDAAAALNAGAIVKAGDPIPVR